jgi:hypothetical protein
VIIGSGLLSMTGWAMLAGFDWSPGWTGMLLFTALGLAAGGFVVTYAAAKEVLPPAVSGMTIALVNTGLFLGAALMQPAFGWMLDLGGQGSVHYLWADYQRGLWLSCAFAGLGLLAATRVRETFCRNQAVAGG